MSKTREEKEFWTLLLGTFAVLPLRLLMLEPFVSSASVFVYTSWPTPTLRGFDD